MILIDWDGNKLNLSTLVRKKFFYCEKDVCTYIKFYKGDIIEAYGSRGFADVGDEYYITTKSKNGSWLIPINEINKFIKEGIFVEMSEDELLIKDIIE